MIDHQLQIDRVPVDKLAPHPENPRRGDVDRIAESLSENGLYRPLVVQQSTGHIIAGNHTWLAARQLGWPEIDATYVDVDDDRARRIMLADNRTSDLGGYDDEALAAVVEAITAAEEAAGLAAAAAGTGYTAEELSEILDAAHQPVDDPDDAPAVDDDYEPVSQPGDVWEIGDHRLVVGDATDPATWTLLLADDAAAPRMIWTDPPYGVDYEGKTSEELTIDNDTDAGLDALLDAVFTQCWAACEPGSPFYVCSPAGPQSATFADQLRDRGWRQTLAWVKNTMVLGRSDYHYAHENLFYGYTPGYTGRRGRGSAGWHGGNAQTSVFLVDKPSRSREHPTMKPVALIEAHLVNSSAQQDVVVDPFAGSGSTLVACQRRNRTARLIEYDARYADVAVVRASRANPGAPILRNGEPAEPPTIA